MNTKNVKPPYYAVIFTSVLSSKDKEYETMANEMLKLAQQEPGFLGFESARDELGISVSYWESLEAIKKWREHPTHGLAQKLGKEKWYQEYTIRICRVESDAFFIK